MKEFYFISFNYGSKDIKRGKELLRKYFLENDPRTRYRENGMLAGLGSVYLESKDNRLGLFLAELKKDGEEPFYRIERKYSESELSSFNLLHLGIKTAGLEGGANYRQEYDYKNSCQNCGSGSTPIPPLLANLSKMGKKQIDSTAHDGCLIISEKLSEIIKENSLTGCESQPCKNKTAKQPDERYYWLQIVSEFPPMTATSIFTIDKACNVCKRSGHFNQSKKATEFHYGDLPKNITDFNLTWEYFGYWQGLSEKGRRPVGGKRSVIVTQKVRQIFKKAKVRNISFEPVWHLTSRST
jgi:hypothetical protein